MENFIIIAIIVLIVALAVTYIVKAKKKGVKCVGCPNAEICSKAQKENCNGCSCGCSSEK